jgi:hypothetical protein
VYLFTGIPQQIQYMELNLCRYFADSKRYAEEARCNKCNRKKTVKENGINAFLIYNGSKNGGRSTSAYSFVGNVQGI